MLLLDVNVVIAAHRVDHAQHAIAGPWLEDVVEAPEPFSVRFFSIDHVMPGAA